MIRYTYSSFDDDDDDDDAIAADDKDEMNGGWRHVTQYSSSHCWTLWWRKADTPAPATDATTSDARIDNLLNTANGLEYFQTFNPIKRGGDDVYIYTLRHSIDRKHVFILYFIKIKNISANTVLNVRLMVIGTFSINDWVSREK